MLIDFYFKKKNGGSFYENMTDETVLRSVVKTISWRLVGTLDTIVIAYFITGTFSHALSIGLIEWVTKIVLYFFHERIWNKFRWGKN